jgi:hypothetical protein
LIRVADKLYDDEIVAEVEKILDDDVDEGGGKIFLTKWKGIEEPRWEPSDVFLDGKILKKYSKDKMKRSKVQMKQMHALWALVESCGELKVAKSSMTEKDLQNEHASDAN